MNENTKWRQWALNLVLILCSGTAAVGTLAPGRPTPTNVSSTVTADVIAPVIVRLDKIESTMTTHIADRTLHLSIADVAVQTSPIRSELEALKAGLASQQRQLDRIEQTLMQLANRDTRTQ